MVRTKVFVGNLSFQTNERDLAKEFEAAGGVASVNIITRFSRSLGYGFVELESEEEARKSVELLNKKVIGGREINVEVARPRDETKKDGTDAANKAPRRPRPFNQARRRRFVRRPQGGDANGDEGAAGSSQPAPRRRTPRPPKTDADRAPRTPSTTTLFVANLPFSVDDAGLTDVFKGFNIKKAHVVRKRNSRSKGFGFVEFNSQEDQQKALAAVDKKKVNDRELIVKVALTEVAAEQDGADVKN
jgi:RNA recognition motif-containing protein